MKQISKMKGLICSKVDDISMHLIRMSDFISENPEIGGKEYLACETLTKELLRNGFEVEKGVGGMSTSFRAEFAFKKSGPSAAFLAEYDALPEIGHACGHNISGMASMGAAIALSKMEDLGGKIICLGTPAEENIGGKYIMLKNDAFKNIDLCMMVHAGDRYTVNLVSQALDGLEFSYKGKAAHAAAAPHEGINALDAVLMLFNSVNALRQQLHESVRIHGIILKGGDAVNIIPENAVARFYIRDKKRSYLEEVTERVKNCARGAALQTGAELIIALTEEPGNEIKQNSVLLDEFKENIGILGLYLDNTEKLLGSTDLGNVSYVVPTIHPMIKTAKEGTALHTKDIVKDGLLKIGHDGLINGTKALAMTGLRVLSDTTFYNAIREEFIKKD